MSTDRGAESVVPMSAIFREANERIRAAAEEHEMAHAIPFLCECPEPECTELVQLSMDEYQAVRSQPARFLQIPEHQSDGDRIVAQRTGYVITENGERAGEVAAAPEAAES
jgi:hypothetical protein